MPPGDAQSTAHRSRGATPYATAVRPAGPIEEGNEQFPAHLTEGDSQSAAHRSEGEPQDTAAARTASLGENDGRMPGEDGGAVPDEMPPGDTQSTAHWSRGATPHTTAVWPAGPIEEGNAQYSADRSGEKQDPAAGQPASPGEDEGARPEGIPPSDAQSSAHRSGCDVHVAAAGPRALDRDGGTGLLDVPRGDGGPRAIFTAGQQRRLQPTPPIAQAFNRYAVRPLGPGDCSRHSSMQSCKECGSRVKPAHMITRLISGFFCERCCPACHPES
jgi:hypothetical protein